MRLSRMLRRTGAGLGLALLGTLGGFAVGLFRRQRPSEYVTHGRAPRADPLVAPVETTESD